MVSGPDIITYIGVPLAVLGVLPIIYNTIATLATVAKVRRILRRGRLAGITRGDVINHVIEVELPRYTIAPLHREEQCKEYWRLCDHPSQIPGGSWTIFNWKTNIIGSKTQRIDYHDQLRQPQAEVGFEELVSFLLDLGAVPDPVGFRMLRGSGLWVPAGTPLLLSADGHEAVLKIAPLDDSDGHLSLAVHWSSDWGMRDHHSLPPYWVLIKGLSSRRQIPHSEEKKSTEDAANGTAQTVEKRTSTSKYIPLSEESPPAIRCQIGTNGLVTAIPDDYDSQMFDSLNTTHLEINDGGINTAGIWFASAITALSTSSQTVLWNYKIPTALLSFAKASTIPCGVLVLLNIVEESLTPEWATKYNDEEKEREARMRKMRDQSREMMRENQMAPEERQKAVNERQMRAHNEWVDELNDKRRREEKRVEQRMLEALQSPKWDDRLVAEHSLAWLKKKDLVETDCSLRRAVEILLWRMVNEPEIALELARMLDG
jgi:Skp family chaperone for outer membrane proteins